MRAVNLIPVEERRGGSGAGSGPPTVWLLVGLGVLVVALAGFVLASNQVSERTAKLAQISTQADEAQSSVTQLKPYVDFASMEQNRTQTVRQLAASRFDWHQSLHDLARVVSKNVWLSSVSGTVAPNVALDGGGSGGGAGGGDSSGLRSALPNPALSISGCATSNDEVVSFVSRLRVMNGVIRVSLSDAQKSDTATPSGGAPSGGAPSSAPPSGASGGSSGGSGAGGDCTNGSDKFPKFDVVVFYQPLAGAVASSGTTGGSATPASAPGAAAAPKGATSTPTPGASSAPASGQSAPGASSPASAGASK